MKRRSILKTLAAAGSMSGSGAGIASASSKSPGSIVRNGQIEGTRDILFEKVFSTPFIDTHEHLIEEKGRLDGHSHPRVPSDDWSILLSHYINSDLITAGMPQAEYDLFFSPETDPVHKWSLIEPYWPHVRNTGYGQASEISMQMLYEVDELSGDTIDKIQKGYESVRRKGFYRHILCDMANIESCQVNSLEGVPFMETALPSLLMQDLSIVGMFAGPDIEGFSKPTGIDVKSLDDWHGVIDWWFDKYGTYATAVKTQNAYSRNIDYEDIPAEKVSQAFKNIVNGVNIESDQRKNIEDHLFWYAVHKATEYNLPVKLHTGYYAGQNYMPLNRLLFNAGAATDLCRISPETSFVFMHICYPYYEELISVAKQYTNAYIDMCWSWIINPLAAKDFLKKYLITAPSNKIVTFGGDYIPVEPVLGHAVIARQGIALALSELVEEGWITRDRALGLVDPVMHGNAREIFKTEVKKQKLKNAYWL